MALATQINTRAEHQAAMARLDQLMGAKAHTHEFWELDRLADAIVEYEKRAFPLVPTDGVDALEYFLDQGTATLDAVLDSFGSEEAFVSFMFRERPVDYDVACALGELLSRPPEHFTVPFVAGVPPDDALIGGTPWRDRLEEMVARRRNASAA